MLKLIDFVDQTGGEHLVDALADALFEYVARPVEYEHTAYIRRAADFELLLKSADRLASGLLYFQRSDHTPHIVGMQFCCCHGIDVLQLAVQRFRAVQPRQIFQFAPELPVCRRPGENSA